MNRHALAEATSLHDGPVPMYLMEEIANSTKASERDAEKIADYMLGRLNKSNLNVKLKALQIISFCIKEGSRAFKVAIKEEELELSAYLQFSGPPDPIYGDEKYRRIRVASQEALVCLNDGFLSRRQNEPPPPPPQQLPQAPCQGTSPLSWQGDAASSYGTANGMYNHPNGQSDRQQSSVGGSWGHAPFSNRPAPYQDHPTQTSSYNPHHPTSSGYNGPSHTSTSGVSGGYHGSSNYAGASGNSGGYGYPHNGPPSRPQPSQPSGLSSWSSSSSAPGMTSKSTGPGVWSSSGYQKKDPVADHEPRYNASTRRDNRPTVLVGHSLHFPKPTGGGPSSGLGGFETGTYNANAVRDTMGGPAYNSNSLGGSSARSGVGGHEMGGTASYGGDPPMNRMNTTTHRIGTMGLPVNRQPLTEVPPTTAIGKKAEVLKKMGTAALEKWDRRNMDKSMASSLADHDELRAGGQVIEPGFYSRANGQQGAGGGDMSRDYERTMIDNLCASAGLSRAPSADSLKRFVDLAQTLDAQTIGDLLLDKLEDETWQVCLKALHVVLALLDSAGAAPYHEFFAANVEVIEALRNDPKPSIVAKALQVLRVLGYVDEDEASETPKRRGTARAPRGGSTRHEPQAEVDLLGFDALSLEPPQGTTATLVASPVHHHHPPPPAPVQEICLLDGYVVGSAPPAASSYVPHQPQQQQQQQQQSTSPYYHERHQEERNKALSHFGKDLFAIANSPRNGPPPPASAVPPNSQSSAFNFM